MTLYLVLLLPFVGALGAGLLRATARNVESWLAGAVAISCAAILASYYPDMAAGRVVQVAVGKRYDLVVAVCDSAHEELGPQLPRLHWSIPDPVRVGTEEAFDAAYTEINDRIRALAEW